ncbi:MAG TPA: hypothetical protein VNN72_26070 [Polyangiaceae bacterium]|nr:hypothetical protein [Polyangiaceae bacterium]
MGNPVAGFSVGAQADWVIAAAAVAPVHLYLAFDGRDVHVAPAAQNASVFLDGRELGPGWQLAPVGCELRFGTVALLVTNEDARRGTQPLHPAIRPSVPAQPGGQAHTQILSRTVAVKAAPTAAGRSEPPPQAEGSRPPMAGFAPVQPAPHVQLRGTQAVQPAGGGAVPAPGHGLTATAQWHTPAAVAMQSRGASAPPAAPAPPAANREQQAPPPANVTKIQPTGMVPLGGMERTLASRTAPAQAAVPPAVQVFASAAAPAQVAVPPAVQVVAAGPPPAQVAMPPAQASGASAPPMPMLAPAEPPPPAQGSPGAAQPSSSAQASDPLGPNTVGDGGALRAHAGRVAEATPSAAMRSGQEYADEVRRASGPTPVPAAGRPAGAANVWPPNAHGAHVPAPEFPAPEAQPVASKLSLAASWREASLPKKLTLVLLPFALVGFVLMLDEPEPEPARVTKAASASPSASAVAASSALAAAASPATAAPASSALALHAGASAPSAVLSVAPPSASAPSHAAAASSVAASAIEVGSAAASSSAAPRPPYAAAERDALTAAFEGRNAEAARLYERLSSASEGKVFALAARLVRENIVLKPAISH